MTDDSGLRPARQWRRRLLWTMAAVALVVVGAGAALAGSSLLGDDDVASDRAVSRAADERRGNRGGGGLDEAQVRATLTRYANLYSAEDVDGIAALFSPDLVRVSLGGPPQDRAKALVEYQRQFATLANPEYELTEASIDPRGDEASADMAYRITEGEREAGAGTIAFHLVNDGGRTLVDEMYIVPKGKKDATSAPKDTTSSDQASPDGGGQPAAPPAQPQTGEGPTVCPLIFGTPYCFEYQKPGDGSGAPGRANPNYYAPRHPRYPNLQGPDPQSNYGPGIYR